MNHQAKRYTLTAALPYANGPLHIGHLAGVYIPADIFARYLRSKKKEVVFICGSDEHGVPVTLRAKKEGISPQEVVDKYHSIIKESLEKFGISFDHYSRTSSKTHYKVASDFFKTLYQKNVFIEEVSQQYYDEKASEFLADRYILGTCPSCQNPNAYGDQCEKCGSTLSPKELIEPRSALSGDRPILKSTKHWYLPLDRYEDFLKQWILKEHKTDWKTNVYGQSKSWIEEGLKARAVTRDLKWGIPVPVQGAEGKVLYVWFDAPIGYISSTIEWAERQGKNWESYWKDKESSLIHFIGKDNIVFHSIIFPVMLKAHGEYILPQNIPANEFLNLENEKISTSRNWAVWLHEYLEDFPNQQDVLRYVLTANMPENKDNNFSWKDFQTHNNSELVGILGNFINRINVLTKKYFFKKVPVPASFNQKDQELIKKLREFPDRIGKSIEQYRFREALSELMKIARIGNKYLADEMPWKTHDESPERTSTVMYVSLQIAGMLTHLSEPFLPKVSEKLVKMFKLSAVPWDELQDLELLKPGHLLGETELLFEKIENSVIDKQRKKLVKDFVDPKKADFDQEKDSHFISFEEFSKVELCTGTIIEAEKIARSDRLLKLEVDTKAQIRTIVSGIAGSFSAEQVIGKQVTVVANLKPRKIRGIESNGMLLMTENSDKKLVFVAPEEKVDNGTPIS